MKTLVYSIHGFDRPSLEAAAAGKHELFFTGQALQTTTAHLAEGCEAVALFTSDNASADTLEKLQAAGVKHLALRSAGYDHVDLKKAKELGFTVANVPAYSPYSIAEHAVTLLMSLNRKVILAQKLMESGDYRLDQLTGFDLFGKTVGIVGTGKIGGAFASIMHGFGCRLLAHDTVEDHELKTKFGLKYVSLDDLCRSCDVISIHCPLNEATRYMFGEAEFTKVKKGLVLINTARGAIVNTRALIASLKNNTVSAAGLDVYENEKPIFFYDHRNKKIDDPLYNELRSLPNVLITGHQAFLTHEALNGIAGTTIQNLDHWQKGERSPNELF